MQPRKKRPHSLYEVGNAREFQNKLESLGINIFEFISEIVYDMDSTGILLGGSIAERTATEVSDVDIALLINEASDLKDFKNEILGESVFYLHRDKSKLENWAVIYHKGIEFNFEIRINPNVNNIENMNQAELSSAIDVDLSNVDDLRLLSRLSTGWPLLNKDIINLWKTAYRVEELCERRVITEFTLAIKEIEDMKSSIDSSAAQTLLLGVHITSRLIKCLLATERFFSPGVKWMRKVDSLINDDSNELAALLCTAKILVFPENTQCEKKLAQYHKEVIGFAAATESYIESVNITVGEVVHWFKEELDLIL